jgi:hypothetical protein
MTDDPRNSAEEPDWMDEIEDLANQQLGHGSACEQVHPIVERWFRKLMEHDPPQSRDSVEQAMACLSTEIMDDLPDELYDGLMEGIEDDELALLIEHVLRIGRAFEASLRTGELDDL